MNTYKIDKRIESNAPGILKDLDLKEASLEEQQIVKSFSRIFHIGFFKQKLFKSVKYTFVFGKPSSEFALKINIDNEILILFADKHNFDKRTLDFVDFTMSEFLNRLDKLCLVIISKDREICAHIEDINKKDPLSRVIVPFYYDELLKDGDYPFFIENRFKKYFYARDLFDFDSPIRTESFFFGRSHLIQHFYDKYRNSENSALFGLRKIGKTSVLYAVQRLMEQKENPIIYIDLLDASFQARRWYEALEYVIEKGYDQLIKFSTFGSKIEKFDPKNAATLFIKYLTKISSLYDNKTVLIIFDEIEQISYGISPTEHWKNGNDFIYFWQTIRSIFQSNRDLLTFVIAGINPKTLESTAFNNIDNPIFKIATPLYLELFTASTVKEMVSKIGGYMGLAFEEEVYYLLHEDFGGHPFLTRMACSRINQLMNSNRPQNISKFWYKKNRDVFIKPVVSYVEHLLWVLSNYYEDEYKLLEILASGNINKFKEILAQTSNAAEHLVGYGLVNIANEEYYFKLKIVEDYFREKNLTTYFIEDKEKRLAEVSRRRNWLEPELRKLILILMRSKYGKETTSKILGSLHVERRIKILESSPEKILKEKFFFSDLYQLILKEWDVFKNIFEANPDKFKRSMQHINEQRVDAHAKDINDHDYNLLITEFNWIEDCLTQILTN